jgi:hypothetical protein
LEDHAPKWSLTDFLLRGEGWGQEISSVHLRDFCGYIFVIFLKGIIINMERSGEKDLTFLLRLGNRK